jgi:hypothetical protein
MGVQDRDWYREPRPRTTWSPRSIAIAAGAFAAAVALVGYTYVHGRNAARPGVSLHIIGGATVPLVPAGLYARNDPWQAYLAPEDVCPGGEDVSASFDRQVETMRCLVDYARGKQGLPPLVDSSRLATAAQLKAEQIARCGQFTRAPCGGDPHQVVIEAGYQGGWGEDLHLAQGGFAASRVALDRWLNSDSHRANLFRASWRVGAFWMLRLPSFGGHTDTTVWVADFGDREDDPGGQA